MVLECDSAETQVAVSPDERERESDREREADRESVTFSCLKGIPVWMKHGVITTSEFGFSVTI